MCEKGPRDANVNVAQSVVSATNLLIDAKKASGSEQHVSAMEELLSVLSKNPGAVDVLAELQNGK